MAFLISLREAAEAICRVEIGRAIAAASSLPGHRHKEDERKDNGQDKKRAEQQAGQEMGSLCRGQTARRVAAQTQVCMGFLSPVETGVSTTAVADNGREA